ncbi:MAG TPA: DUF4097 family beta strand repeat-containing protein [Bryobacteraceae bacterium]
MRKLFALLAVSGSLVFLSGCMVDAAATRGHFDRTLKVSGAVDLDVQSGAGDIAVRTGGSGTVVVHARIYASHWNAGDIEHRVHYLESHPQIEQNGNTIRVGHTNDRDLMHNISISYEVIVPAETKLHASSGSGDERIDGMHGPVDASSGSGHVTLSHIGSQATAHTGSGDIDLNSVHGNVKAGTGSGSIHATGIAGGFSASTGSGDVRLEQTAPGKVNIGTGSGSIEIRGANGAVDAHTGSGNIAAQGQPKGDWTLHTASGSLNVTFPGTAAYDLVAHTGSGGIHIRHTIEFNGKWMPHNVQGKVGGGGPAVDLNTSSGSIRID